MTSLCLCTYVMCNVQIWSTVAFLSNQVLCALWIGAQLLLPWWITVPWFWQHKAFMAISLLLGQPALRLIDVRSCLLFASVIGSHVHNALCDTVLHGRCNAHACCSACVNP